MLSIADVAAGLLGEAIDHREAHAGALADALRGEAGANDAVFPSREGGGHLTERTVNGMVKRTAARAGINEAVSPHWLRHAHGSHAIDRGASLPEVQTTLGHGNIATTSGYLHARPGYIERSSPGSRGVPSMKTISV